MKRALALLLLLTSCSSQIATRTAYAPSQSALDEVRVALIDVRQAYSSQQMEMRLLEEKVERLSPGPSRKVPISDLEARLAKIETLFQQLEGDLRNLATHANSTNSSLSSYKKELTRLDRLIASQQERLNEVVKLKSTLKSISKAIGSPASTKTYTVRAGDSLEKIARKHGTTVADLKSTNNLSSTRIIIGQKLHIP